MVGRVLIAGLSFVDLDLARRFQGHWSIGVVLGGCIWVVSLGQDL